MGLKLSVRQGGTEPRQVAAREQSIRASWSFRLRLTLPDKLSLGEPNALRGGCGSGRRRLVVKTVDSP